jgi:solute carrier family 35 protein E3
MGVDMETLGCMLMNFSTSVAIISVNKFAYEGGFDFVAVQTALHFLVTFLGLELCARLGVFERKLCGLMDILPISFAFSGFVVFNNLSLRYNLVGTYQLWKVMTTPAIVGINWVLYSTKMPSIEIATLCPVCLGVLLATSGEMGANFTGTIFALLGLVSTSFYQIWVKSEQSRLQLDAWQLLYLQAPVSMVMLCCIAPFMDDVERMRSQTYSTATLLWLALSAALAFLVNLSIFLVIKRTDPVSYNVLGHGKLCTILLSSYFLFNEPCPTQRAVGIALALVGIFSYTTVKLQGSGPAKKDDKKKK